MPLDTRRHRSIPKLVGADFELGNFILGLEHREGTGPEASRALLREIDGVPAAGYGYEAYGSYGSASRYGSYGSYGYRYGWGDWSGGGSTNAQDRGRKFLATNGGCAYIDLDHLELCIPEVLSAFDHAAATAAMLRLAREAQVHANRELPAGQSIQVLVNNSDGRSNSYGSHLNFLISRPTWDDILERRPHYLQFLATHQLSAMIYTGQGKVGSENERPEVAYQISQRADFFETVTGTQTTYRRPIVNSRDETLCGKSGDLARLHVIGFDNTLCHGANVLKVGTMQIVLAMLEAQDVDTRISIDDLVSAAVDFSHDPSLQKSVRLVEGGRATAIEIQQRILEHARQHRDAHGFETVPRADEILSLWEDTLSKLAAGDLDALAGRVDWILKLRVLERALEQRPDLDWKSPELKYLDQIFGSLDPDEGLFWPHVRSGLVEALVSDEEIERFRNEPPSDTRAWMRAMILRRFDRNEIERVDWDRISLWTDMDGARSSIELRLDDPLGFTRESTESLFQGAPFEGDSNENP
jgi:proteasome accessory factor A